MMIMEKLRLNIYKMEFAINTYQALSQEMAKMEWTAQIMRREPKLTNELRAALQETENRVKEVQSQMARAESYLLYITNTKDVAEARAVYMRAVAIYNKWLSVFQQGIDDELHENGSTADALTEAATSLQSNLNDGSAHLILPI